MNKNSQSFSIPKMVSEIISEENTIQNTHYDLRSPGCSKFRGEDISERFPEGMTSCNIKVKQESVSEKGESMPWEPHVGRPRDQGELWGIKKTGNIS